jgi:hypothetical protein
LSWLWREAELSWLRREERKYGEEKRGSMERRGRGKGREEEEEGKRRESVAIVLV